MTEGIKEIVKSLRNASQSDDYFEKVAKYEQAEKEKSEAVKQKKLMAFYKTCNIEPEYYDLTIDDYVPKTESQERAKKLVQDMISSRKGKLILLGTNGCGKTMLASIVAKELEGKIYTMYEISTMIRQSYTVKAERSELEIVNDLASVPFLAIDELGRTKGGDAEQNWLSYILDKRHTRKLPFMLLSNGHFKKQCPSGGCSRCFENFMDNDILSRLREDAQFIVIEAPDERMLKRRQNEK